MKLRTVVIATLLAYGVYFREGDNEYPKIYYTGSKGTTAEEVYAAKLEALTAAVYGGSKPLEPASSTKPGAWLVFERLILLRYQALPNQGRSTPPKRIMTQTPQPPKGWVAMTMPGFLRALA